MERQYCGKNGFYIINGPYTVEEELLDQDGAPGEAVSADDEEDLPEEEEETITCRSS